MSAKELITSGQLNLGIELGSTRIKAILIGTDPNEVIAAGSFEWENQLVDGLWSYPLDQVWHGLKETFANLQQDCESRHRVRISKLNSLGVSAMMHGYLAFDSGDELLVPFRTWRNTNTQQAADQLTELFGVNIPLRWSIAHLQQVILENAQHVANIDFLTTLAGYVQYKLSGEKVLGIGDASGMFPIDPATKTYDQNLVNKFQELNQGSALRKHLLEILPKVLVAGQSAGALTEQGAQLLDPTGELQAGAAMCPPEGDAGTGMVATNAVAPTTGNISAGTSIFAMVVMERPLTQIHHELDIVTTPSGDPVAMVHCNNGASELAAWVNVFDEFAKLSGSHLNTDGVYELLFHQALTGELDAGGLVSYNYLAGEPITGLSAGRPMTIRTPDSNFSLANFMRSQIFGVFATLSIGMDVLKKENVEISVMSAHGGIFRTAGVAQKLLAAAIEAPVSVSSSASEGGAWGMAILAAFAASGYQDLGSYLNNEVFNSVETATSTVTKGEIAGYQNYLSRYTAGLAAVKSAAEQVS